MGRWTRMLLIAMTIFLGFAVRAHATTYYVAANGSDSNNGTSESSPWQHAPGMPNCTANCAAKTPQPGDSFIFRGGDAWHQAANINDSSDVYMGGTWAWIWSGSGGGSTCNFDIGASSTCIYIGVDTTTPWYNSSVCGSSFCRPQLELDNPVWANSPYKDSSHPGFVTQCVHDDNTPSNLSVMSLQRSTEVILDNFNVWGRCYTTQTSDGPPYIYFDTSVTPAYRTFEHLYIHGWTIPYSPGPSQGPGIDGVQFLGGEYGGSAGANHDVFAYNVFDGTDSNPGATADMVDGNGNPVGDGGGITYNDCYEFYDNVVRWMTQALNPCYNSYSIHDNLFEDMFGSFDPAVHSAIFENANCCDTGPAWTQYFYNNTIRNSLLGETFSPQVINGQIMYVFNNVIYNVGNGGNCMFITAQGSGATYYFTNNTIVSPNSWLGSGADPTPCGFRTSAANGAKAVFQNNQLIGFGCSGPVSGSCVSGGGLANTDNGGEVFQTAAAANEQGYTPSDNYEPPSGGCTSSANCATYETGADLAVECANDGTALCSGSTGGVVDAAGTGTLPVLDILQPILRGVSWDAGAYQYSQGSSSQPVAPTDLIATVQ